MKVITVSRTFPAYHPKAGHNTEFVEKIWSSFNEVLPKNICSIKEIKTQIDNYREYRYQPKHHTIRAGHRFKTGEMASLRVWSGKPYNSPQIEFAEVKVTCFDIEIKNKACIINGNRWPDFVLTEPVLGPWNLHKLADNDGLSVPDLLAWFKMPCDFTGQIICWNDSITY